MGGAIAAIHRNTSPKNRIEQQKKTTKFSARWQTDPVKSNQVITGGLKPFQRRRSQSGKLSALAKRLPLGSLLPAQQSRRNRMKEDERLESNFFGPRLSAAPQSRGLVAGIPPPARPRLATSRTGRSDGGGEALAAPGLDHL